MRWHPAPGKIGMRPDALRVALAGRDHRPGELPPDPGRGLWYRAEVVGQHPQRRRDFAEGVALRVVDQVATAQDVDSRQFEIGPAHQAVFHRHQLGRAAIDRRGALAVLGLGRLAAPLDLEPTRRHCRGAIAQRMIALRPLSLLRRSSLGAEPPPGPPGRRFALWRSGGFPRNVYSAGDQLGQALLPEAATDRRGGAASTRETRRGNARPWPVPVARRCSSVKVATSDAKLARWRRWFARAARCRTPCRARR